jgi:hypothetical protein
LLAVVRGVTGPPCAAAAPPAAFAAGGMAPG